MGFVSDFIGETNFSKVSYGLGFLFSYFVLLTPWFVIEKILKLWPSVEFDFGPEYEKKDKNNRNKMYFIIVNLLLPIILGLLLNFLSK